MSAFETAPQIHIFHHSYCEGGGIERYCLDFVGELLNQGRNVTVHARRIDLRDSVPQGLRLERIRTLTIPRKLRDYYYHRRIQRLAPSLKGIQFAMTRVPVRDGEVCGGTHRGYFKNARKTMGPFDRLQVSMEMKSYHACKTVVSHSQLCTSELQGLYGLQSAHIATIHPPADLKRFSPVDDEQRNILRQQFGFQKGKVVFAFPSSGHKRKGLYPLIDALRPFASQVTLALAGRDSSKKKPDYVRYMGRLSGDGMADLYRAADFTAMASYYEPFGLIGPESIMCGTPVMFERNMGCLEVIDRKVATTFNVWDRESIQQAVASAIDQVNAGNSRMYEPQLHLTYDASVETHVRKVMDVLESPTK
jgi:glycosyltransferase involved in cell wall biosynthesis